MVSACSLCLAIEREGMIFMLLRVPNMLEAKRSELLQRPVSIADPFMTADRQSESLTMRRASTMT